MQGSLPAVEPETARRRVFITGAAGGLGAGIALRLAEAGWAVTLTHRPGGTPPDRVLDDVRRYDSGAASYPADVADQTALRAVVRRVEAEHGTVDALVHAAGPLEIARVERAEYESFERLLAANLTSAVTLALELLPAMRARRFGRMIFFGMTGSSVTRPARGMAFYGAAKAGLTAFAKTLALEEAQYGITVNCIEPGDIRDKTATRPSARQTPANNPSGHAGSWEDIADAVRYFMGDEAGFVNGAVLAVGGGLVDASQ